MVSVIDAARSQLGVKYTFGAEQAGVAFDCSGLVQYAFDQAGITLPRTAAEQQRSTTLVSAKGAQPGDLVFFGAPAHHVGIYLGGGKFLESPHTGDVVKIADVGSGVTFGRVKGATPSQLTAGRQAAVTAATQPDSYVSYGFSQALANSVPDIKKILGQATAGGWDVQRFQDALQNTSWWKQHSDSAKKFITMAKQDPAEYTQQYNAAQTHVKQLAAQMGVGLSAHQVKTLATTDLYQGLDDQTLQGQIAGIFRSVPGGMTGGTSVQLQTQIQQLASQYGVPVTQGWINNEIASSLKQGNGIEAAQASLQQQAMSLYAPIADQLKSGQTTQQIAQPYVAQMSQTLELGDGSLGLDDPTIKKALMGQLPSSTAAPTATGTKGSAVAAPAAPTTLYDFQNALRNDPRWEHTNNAKASAYAMVHGLGQSFGFAS